VSLITSCPACGTSFRVTPEHLSAHRGDVRCGQCQHIFNALKQLAEVAPPTSAPQDPPSSQLMKETPAFEETVIIPQSLEIAPQVEEDAGAKIPETQQPRKIAETLDIELEIPTQAAAEVDLPPQPESAAIEPSVAIALEPAPSEAEAQIVESTPESPDSITPEPERPAGELLTGKPKPKTSTLLLALLALLLLLATLGQSAYFMRTEIASQYPPAKPWLQKACRWLGCIVELPRNEKLLAIEDSDLQDDPEHEGTLVLVSLINNLAPYPQAYPLLELTLTDTFDKPVLRRTFTPQEYLSKDVALAQGIAAGGESHVRLNLSVAGTKPAGYRLIVKY